MRPAWTSCSDHLPLGACARDWMDVVAKQACALAYSDEQGNKIPANFSLADAYYNARITSIDEAISRGGVRLASALDRVWQTRKAATDAREDEKPQNDDDKGKATAGLIIGGACFVLAIGLIIVWRLKSRDPKHDGMDEAFLPH
eukprot:GABV01000823.1.p2 GENE.GABV01000823.1~~GABV01000823.1.p2  ORF type:complete len:144 (-),score=53.35 GABV01000823.1:5-436(-)